MFWIVPIIASFALSLTEYNIITSPHFVGLENYRDMLQDRTFWVLSSIEEDLELLGVFVVVRLLLAELRAAGQRLTLSVSAG